MKKRTLIRVLIASAWLIFIYTFLPFAPNLINYLYKRFGYATIKQILWIATILGAAVVYFPFFRNFKSKTFIPYLLISTVLSLAVYINITLNTAARAFHIPEYTVLAILISRAMYAIENRWRVYLFTMLIASICGIIDERVIQYILPMRYYDFTDMLLNLYGVITGLVILLAYDFPVRRR